METPITPLSYWRYLRLILRGLLVWGSGSVAGGTLLALTTNSEFRKQFGWQQAAWGAIDAAIALAGWRNVETQYTAAQNEHWDGDPRAEANRLWWILLINGVLDAGYIAGGAWLLRQPDERKQGMGAGIVVQGGFLLLWDFAHALTIGRWLRSK